jgi:hypothetical protein
MKDSIAVRVSKSDRAPTEEELSKHGITTEQVTYYLCGKYRYTSYKSALAQAVREEKAS